MYGLRSLLETYREKLGSVRGCNYIPHTAVNTVEMWRAPDETPYDASETELLRRWAEES